MNVIISTFVIILVSPLSCFIVWVLITQRQIVMCHLKTYFQLRPLMHDTSLDVACAFQQQPNFFTIIIFGLLFS